MHRHDALLSGIATTGALSLGTIGLTLGKLASFLVVVLVATGASIIIGIGRSGANIINPGPDEELPSGDQVLLLGTRAQLDAARATFGQSAATR